MQYFIADFCTECGSERIFKIGQYLAKIWTKVWWHVFFDSQCIVAAKIWYLKNVRFLLGHPVYN